MNLKSNLHLPLVLSVVFVFTLPVLIQDAMFQDAVLYSSVSHNLSIGYGTFWFPQYSTLNLEGIPSFHEQPPLVFGIQALFYKLLGSSMYVERFYTLLMILLHILLINILWKDIFKNNPNYSKHGWLPVLFWIIIPVCYWSFRGNMIENTVSVFTLCSVIIAYRNIQSEKLNVLAWLCSGFFIFLASFSKGVPGFFPLTFPFIYWLVTRRISFSRSMVYTSILLAVPLVIYGIFLMIPESRHSLSIYFYDRLVNRVNSMPTADYRLEIVWRLFTELIPVYILVFIAVMSGGVANFRKQLPEVNENFLLFLLTGLAGSLPLALTMVQKGWYMVPSFPFFGLAFAAVAVPPVSSLTERIKLQSSGFKFFRMMAVLVFLIVLGITYMQKGKISREEATLTDVYRIGKLVPRFSTMTVPEEEYDQYNFVLQGFLVRYFNISISPYKEYDYFLREKSAGRKVPNGYKLLDIGLSKYDLYKRE